MAYIRGTANNLSGPGINHVFLPSFGGTPYDFIAGGMVKREAVVRLLWRLWRLSGRLGWFISHLTAAACMGQIRASIAVFLAAHARESSHLALLLHFSKRGALANETGVVGRDNVIRSALCKISAFLIRWLGYGIEFKIEVIRHGAEDEDV